MISSEALRKAVSASPGFLALAVLLSPAPGFEVPKYLAVALCLVVLVASFFLRSDSLHFLSLSGLAVVLGILSSQAGFLASFATVTFLVVLLDVSGLAKSLLGLTHFKGNQATSAESPTYVSMIRRRTVRSGGVGLASFLVSIAIVSTPGALITFTNPVSGSGLLALASMLLIALAAFGVGAIARDRIERHKQQETRSESV